MPDIPHRLRGAIRALRWASHPDRMTGPYAMALAGLADDIEAGRVVMREPAREPTQGWLDVVAGVAAVGAAVAWGWARV